MSRSVHRKHIVTQLKQDVLSWSYHSMVLFQKSKVHVCSKLELPLLENVWSYEIMEVCIFVILNFSMLIWRATLYAFSSGMEVFYK